MPLDWLQQKSKAELAQLEDDQHKYYIVKFEIELLFSTVISLKAKFKSKFIMAPRLKNELWQHHQDGPEVAITINYDWSALALPKMDD